MFSFSQQTSLRYMRVITISLECGTGKIILCVEVHLHSLHTRRHTEHFLNSAMYSNKWINYIRSRIFYQLKRQHAQSSYLMKQKGSIMTCIRYISSVKIYIRWSYLDVHLASQLIACRPIVLQFNNLLLHSFILQVMIWRTKNTHFSPTQNIR